MPLSLWSAWRRRRAPALTGSREILWTDPGCVYRVTLATDRNQDTPGTQWRDGDLGGSPLEPMLRPALIFKADDFGGPLTASAVEFIETVDGAGGVAGLGVVTSLLGDDPRVHATYRQLDGHGFELWFHGHDHNWQLPQAEFAGVGVDQQASALARGLRRARDLLGIEMRSFGAPGNAFDAATAAALDRQPQLVVWLFGRDGGGRLVLSREVELEDPVGVVRPPDDLRRDLDALGDREVVTLQAHPLQWRRRDLRRFATILDAARARGLRLTTPHGWWCWVRDRARIRIIKEATSVYRIDASGAQHRHRLLLGGLAVAAIVTASP